MFIPEKDLGVHDLNLSYLRPKLLKKGMEYDITNKLCKHYNLNVKLYYGYQIKGVKVHGSEFWIDNRLSEQERKDLLFDRLNKYIYEKVYSSHSFDSIKYRNFVNQNCSILGISPKFLGQQIPTKINPDYKTDNWDYVKDFLTKYMKDNKLQAITPKETQKLFTFSVINTIKVFENHGVYEIPEIVKYWYDWGYQIIYHGRKNYKFYLINPEHDLSNTNLKSQYTLLVK